MSPVIRAIECSDIMDQIFSHFAPILSPEYPQDDKFNAQTRGTLAKCATASRAFSDRALNVLWGTLDDIVLLLKVLPHYMRGGPGSSDGLLVRPIFIRLFSRSNAPLPVCG